MSNQTNQVDIVRAWKDEEYRAGLPAEVRDRLPAAPANADDLSDEQLAEAAGGGPGTVLAVATAATLMPPSPDMEMTTAMTANHT